MQTAKQLFAEFVESHSQEAPVEISLDDMMDHLLPGEEVQFFTSSTLGDDGEITQKVSWGIGTPVHDDSGEQVDFNVRVGGPASPRVDWENVDQEQVRCRYLEANDQYPRDCWYLTAVRQRVGTEIVVDLTTPKSTRKRYAENEQPV